MSSLEENESKSVERTLSSLDSSSAAQMGKEDEEYEIDPEYKILEDFEENDELIEEVGTIILSEDEEEEVQEEESKEEEDVVEEESSLSPYSVMLEQIISNEPLKVTPSKEDICKYSAKTLVFPSSIDFPEYEPLGVHKDIQKDKYSSADYSNKMIILNKDNVEIVKERLEFENKDNLLFILNKNTGKELDQNEYHLDDLHCSVAKAMGFEPDQVKLTYMVSKTAPINRGYVKFALRKNLIETDSLKPDIDRIFDVKCFKTELEDGERYKKFVRVSIQNLTYGTHWLGGFRHKVTGKYYHNATTQTEPRRKGFHKPQWEYMPQLLTRDTQTPNPSRDVVIDMPRDRSTQMWRTDYYMPSCTDRYITPGVYRPFETDEKRQAKAALIIQKHWRGYLSRKMIDLDYAIKENHRLKQFKIMLLQDCTLRGEHISRKEYNVRMLDMIYPKKRKDFYTLHWLLRKFKSKNVKELESIKLETSRQTKLYEFLEKEVNYLNSIYHMRDIIRGEAFNLKYKKTVEENAMPIIKENTTKHCLYLIEKSGIERNRELKELYVLFRKDMAPEQRVEIILLFKQLMQYYQDFDMKDDLIELFDRECVLIFAGVPQTFLEGLRKRVEEIIFHFVTSHANKEDLKKLCPKNIIRCKYCRKFKQVRDFPLHLRQMKINICRSCQFLYDTSYLKDNLAPYQDLLNNILINEFMSGCPNPYASILRPLDLYHLVQTIWKGRSIISDISIISQLQLARWERRHPWAPWNCILLTKEEAKHHEIIDDVLEFYGTQFCNLVHYKHVRTILEFPSILDIESKTRDLWTKLSDKQLYEHKVSLLESFNQKQNDMFFIPPPLKH